jgi:hypothetical protein
MSFDSWCQWHLSEVCRRLRAFMGDASRRQIVKEREIQYWHDYHDVERRVIVTTLRPR